jgi:hypothetical protein
MPRATVDTSVQHHDLKSLPEGFVELRRMSYGDWLVRQDMTMNMQITGSSKDDAAMDMKANGASIAAFEFSKCLVDHNLEDEEGVKLRLPEQLNMLDPRVGIEIGDLLDKLHEYDEGN